MVIYSYSDSFFHLALFQLTHGWLESLWAIFLPLHSFLSQQMSRSKTCEWQLKPLWIICSMTEVVVGNAIGVNSSMSSLALGVCLLYSEPQKLILGNCYVSVK